MTAEVVMEVVMVVVRGVEATEEVMEAQMEGMMVEAVHGKHSILCDPSKCLLKINGDCYA